MREILFRGKRFDNGEWAYGYFIESVLKGSVFGYIKQSNTADDVKVYKKTVGQFTGLYDKNGKKIFEGDIVLHHNDDPYGSEEKGQVYWDEKFCSWRRTSNGAFHHGIAVTYRMSSTCVYEVIGTIHDNPELLKGETE